MFVFSIPTPPTVTVTRSPTTPPRASLEVSGRAAQMRHLLSLNNQAPQQHVSKHRAPQQSRSSSVAPTQDAATGANGVPAALASNGSDPHFNGGGASGGARGESAGADSGDDTIATLTKKIVRQNATIQVGGCVGVLSLFLGGDVFRAIMDLVDERSRLLVVARSVDKHFGAGPRRQGSAANREGGFNVYPRFGPPGSQKSSQHHPKPLSFW